LFDRTTTEYAENWATSPEAVKNFKEESTEEMVYNSLGQQTKSVIKQTEESLITTLPFYHETSVETRVSKFDNEGRVARQTRTTTDGSKVTTESSLEDMKYDNNGRFYSSATRVIDTATDTAGNPILNHTVINRILSSKYNAKGRLVEQEKEKREWGEFGKQVLETMTISEWDGVGRATKTLIQSEERANLDSAENRLHHFFETESIVTLNKLGQVLTSTTKMFNDSGAPDRVSTNERFAFTYDSLGRATKYTETQTSTAGPQRMTKIEKSGILYDSANRPITWTETSNPLLLDAKGGIIDLTKFSFTEADLKKALAPDATSSSLIDLTLEGLADLLANSVGALSDSLENLGNSSLLSIFEMILKPAVEKMARAKMGDDHYSDSFRDFIVNGLLAELTSLETPEGEDIIGWKLGDFIEKLMKPTLGGNTQLKYDVVYSKTISGEVEAILGSDVSNEEKTLSQLVTDNVYSDTSKTLRSILRDLFTAAIARDIPGISIQDRETDVDNMLNLTQEFVQIIPPAVQGEAPASINWLDKTLQQIIDAVAGGSSPPFLNFKLKDLVKKLEFEISIDNPTLDLSIDELADGPNGAKTLKNYLTEIIISGMKLVNTDTGFTIQDATNLATGMLDRKAEELTGPTEVEGIDSGLGIVDTINYLDASLASIAAIVKQEGWIYPVSGQSTVRDLLHNLVFSGAGALTIKEWHSVIFKSTLPALTLKNSSSAFSTSFGDLMGHMFKPGTESWLTKINSALQGALQDYTDKTKTSTQITGISYDTDGRLLTRTETKSWQDIGGGGIPGWIANGKMPKPPSTYDTTMESLTFSLARRWRQKRAAV
jgi:hypothetical protein